MICYSPICVEWNNPYLLDQSISILRVRWLAIFILYSNFNLRFCKQTVASDLGQSLTQSIKQTKTQSIFSDSRRG